MTDDNIRLFGDFLRASSPERILDLAAARGHFLQFARTQLSPTTLVAMDPHPELLGTTLAEVSAELLPQDFHRIERELSFDFIYSCHSLEHYRNPLEQLQYISTHLSESGHALIDVPDFDSIDLTAPLDEFFYDQHRTYFSCRTLENAILQAGLTVVRMEHSAGSVKALVARSSFERQHHVCVADLHSNSESKILRYAEALKVAREALPEAVHQLASIRSPLEPLVVFGAGRVLDAAIRYGGLGPENIALVVDSFLHGLVRPFGDVPVSGWESFQTFNFDAQPLCVVFANSSATQLLDEIRRVRPGVEAISFRDIVQSTLENQS